MSVDLVRECLEVAVERRSANERRGFHAGYGANLSGRAREHRRDLFVGVVLRRREAELHGEDVIRVESGVHARERDEAPREQARAHEQHDAERDLSHHEDVAGA